MHNSEEQLNNIEVSIEQAGKIVGKMDSLLKLTNNKEFISIIEEGYFKDEASRLVLLKADPSLQSEGDQKLLDNSIISVSYLRQYFVSIMQLGRMSQKALHDDMETRDELLAGDA